jgi:hypothetical protein
MAPSFGQWCYDFTKNESPDISNDYLAILGASTYQGFLSVESAQFCGIFDGLSYIFPGIYGMFKLFREGPGGRGGGGYYIVKKESDKKLKS